MSSHVQQRRAVFDARGIGATIRTFGADREKWRTHHYAIRCPRWVPERIGYVWVRVMLGWHVGVRIALDRIHEDEPTSGP